MLQYWPVLFLIAGLLGAFRYDQLAWIVVALAGLLSLVQ